MKKFFENIVLTKTTIALAIITVIAVAINNYASVEFVKKLSVITQDNNTAMAEFNKLSQPWEQYCRWVGLPLMLVSLVLPLFWAWQNYMVFKKKWLFVVTFVPIYFQLQHVVAIAVFLLYLILFWQEFENWRSNNSASS